MQYRKTVLLRIGAICTALTASLPAHAENWSTMYSDSDISVSYDTDSVDRMEDETVFLMWRTTFAEAQYPEPDSSISETTAFYTRQQYVEIDCANQMLWILGVWYLDYGGQMLGGGTGEGPEIYIRSGTVAELLSQRVCN